MLHNELLDNAAYRLEGFATELDQPQQLCSTLCVQCMLPVRSIANGVGTVCLVVAINVCNIRGALCILTTCCYAVDCSLL